jgi:N-methylhydantoinase A
MVVADRAVSVQAGCLGLLSEADPSDLAARYATLEKEARALLPVPGYESQTRMTRSAAMRYELQEWELRVALPEVTFDAGAATTLADAFHDAHLARFGFARPDKPVELVTLYLDATVVAPRVQYGAATLHGGATADALLGTRRVWIDADHGALDASVFERSRLAVGASLQGPCIVEESSATTFLQPGWAAIVDGARNLVARPERGSR